MNIALKNAAAAVGAIACALVAADPSFAACLSDSAMVMCDANAPNPVRTGVVGNNIQLLRGATVQFDDPFAFPGFRDQTVVLNAGGRLNAVAGSQIYGTPIGGAAVASGINSTIIAAGRITATASNAQGVLLGGGGSLTLSQGGVIETLQNGSIFDFQNTTAAIATSGNGTTIQVDGTVQSFGSNAPAIRPYSSDNFNTNFYTTAISVGSTGLVATYGSNSPSISIAGGSSVTVAGQVRANGSGSSAILYRAGSGSSIALVVQAGGIVQANQAPVITGTGADVDLTIAGSVLAGLPGQSAIALGSGNDHLTLVTGATIRGTIDGGAGDDLVTLAGAGSATFSGAANFERLEVASGNWTLASATNFTNGVNIGPAGSLTGSAAMLTGAIANNGILVVDQPTNASFDATLTGSGLLRKTGIGVLRLSNPTSFIGPIEVLAGTLQMGGDNLLANDTALTTASGATFDLAGHAQTIGTLNDAGTVALGTGTLALGGAGASSITGDVTGTGVLSKTGTGMLMLSGAKSMTGRIDLISGTAQFTGSTAGNVRVAGGTLTGTATIAGNLALSSGTVSPGVGVGSFGSFQAGSLTVSGGMLAFDVGGSASGFAADTIKVTDAATLSGGTVSVVPTEVAANYKMVQRYILVSAGGVTGTFGNGSSFVQTSANSGLYYRLRYDLDPNTVVLELRKPVDFLAGLDTGGTPNQRAVASALTGGQLAGSDAWVNALSNIAALTPAQQAAAFGALSGEQVANVTTAAINASDRFVDMLRDRISIGSVSSDNSGMLLAGLSGNKAMFQQARVGASTQGSAMGLIDGAADSSERSGVDGPSGGNDARHIGMWVQGFGASGTLTGNNSTNKMVDGSSGIAVGVDAQVGQLRLGGAFAADHLDTKLRALQSKSEGTVHQGAVYAAYDNGHAFVNAIASYFEGHQSETRTVLIGDSSIGQASGRPDLKGWSGAAAAGVRIAFDNGLRLTPQIDGGFTHVKRDAFSEGGIGVFSLDVAQDKRTLYTTGGELRLSKPIAMGGGIAEPYLSGGVVFNLGDRSAVSAMRFSGAPTGTGAFVVNGVSLPREAAKIMAGVQVEASRTVSFGVGATTLFANRQHEGAANIHIRIGF